MRIQRPGSDQVLIEVKQVMPSGEERLRGDVPGEKMLAGEESAAAALRGVKEELGERLKSEPRMLGVLHETTEVKTSASYPGLRCRYTFYEVEIEIADLPEGAFTTTETEGDKALVHHWDWRKEHVQLQGDLYLEPPQMRLLEQLNAGHSKVKVSRMHGGLSGSLVTRTQSYDTTGHPEDPTVTKIDKEAEVRREVEQTKRIRSIVGEGVIEIVREPEYRDGYGAFTIEMAGACWSLPQFHGTLKGVELISTLKKHITVLFTDTYLMQSEPSSNLFIGTYLMQSEPSSQGMDKSLQAVRELWGAGGPLSKLALKTTRLDDAGACEPGGRLPKWLREVAERLAVVLLPPPSASTTGSVEPASVVDAAPDELRSALESGADLSKLKKHGKSFRDSFVHEVDSSLWASSEACAPFVQLINMANAALSQPPEWLKAWQPLVNHQHGDINLANILVDVRDNLWLIDFAKSGIMSPFEDAAFFISRLLFQHLIIPPTIADIQRAKLQDEHGKAHPNLMVDVMEVGPSLAARLQVLSEGCNTKTDLRDKMQAAEDNGELLKLLPRIAEDHDAAQRYLDEACEVVDVLLGFVNGEPPRDPDALWNAGQD